MSGSEKVFFEWSEELSLGLQKIDVQHLTMIGFINEAHRLMEGPYSPNEMKQVLNNLIDYAKVHFTYEEKLMNDNGFPGLEEHRKEHAIYSKTVEKYYFEYRAGQAGVDEKLCQFLKDWLHGHIMDTDKKYAKFLKNIPNLIE